MTNRDDFPSWDNYDWAESGQRPPELNRTNLKRVAGELWKAMFEFPVIIPCAYCNAMNAVTNPTCVACGAPMGQGYSQAKNDYLEFGGYRPR